MNLELNSTRNNGNRSKIEQAGAFEFAASDNYMQRKRSSSVPIVVKKFVSIICNTRLYLHYTVHINVDGGQGVVFYNGRRARSAMAASSLSGIRRKLSVLKKGRNVKKKAYFSMLCVV